MALKNLPKMLTSTKNHLSMLVMELSSVYLFNLCKVIPSLLSLPQKHLASVCRHILLLLLKLQLRLEDFPLKDQINTMQTFASLWRSKVTPSTFLSVATWRIIDSLQGYKTIVGVALSRLYQPKASEATCAFGCPFSVPT